MTFGEKLRELRLQAGLTQAQLAELSDVKLGTIRDYEQGKRDPLLSTAQKLARALKQSLDVFPSPEIKARRSRRATGEKSRTRRNKGSGGATASNKERKPTRRTGT